VLLAAPTPDPSTAKVACELEGLLPPVPGAAVWDLAKLNDTQLEQLAQLAAVATGEAMPEPEPVPVVPERSARFDRAGELVKLLDALAPEGEPWVELELSEAARSRVHGLLSEVLSPFRLIEFFERYGVPLPLARAGRCRARMCSRRPPAHRRGPLAFLAATSSRCRRGFLVASRVSRRARRLHDHGRL